jgi:hypothetical protein
MAQTKITKNQLDNELVNITDIVDNRTSTDTDKPLSANQGKINRDAIVINQTNITALQATVGSLKTPTIIAFDPDISNIIVEDDYVEISWNSYEGQLSFQRKAAFIKDIYGGVWLGNGTFSEGLLAARSEPIGWRFFNGSVTADASYATATHGAKGEISLFPNSGTAYTAYVISYYMSKDVGLITFTIWKLQ